MAVDHLHNDIFLLALAQPQLEASESAAQHWLKSTEAAVQSLLPEPLCRDRPLSSHRDVAGMCSISSLSGSSQTNQHMDTTSSDTVRSDSEWSHRDQRGSFSSLDSLIADQGAPTASKPTEHHQTGPIKDSEQQCHTVDASHATGHSQHQQAQPESTTADKGMEVCPPFKLARSKAQYLRDVAACQQALHDGDSYEICLTTALVRPRPVDALRLYRRLRKVNPAPYAAWMSFGADDLQICCSSPERFLKGGRGGLLEARPIKGTAPRSAEPEQDRAAALALANSEKDQAENLMIVDLLRNDLGRVCQVGVSASSHGFFLWSHRMRKPSQWQLVLRLWLLH